MHALNVHCRFKTFIFCFFPFDSIYSWDMLVQKSSWKIHLVWKFKWNFPLISMWIKVFMHHLFTVQSELDGHWSWKLFLQAIITGQFCKFDGFKIQPRNKNCCFLSSYSNTRTITDMYIFIGWNNVFGVVQKCWMMQVVFWFLQSSDKQSNKLNFNKFEKGTERRIKIWGISNALKIFP